MDFELGFLNAFVIQKNYASLQVEDFYISTFQTSVLAKVFVESLKARWV